MEDQKFTIQEIDLLKILKEIYVQKKLIISFLSLVFFLSVVYSYSQDNYFEATATISFQDNNNLSESDLPKGIDSLFGLNSNSSREEIFFETLTSYDFLSGFIKKRELVPLILASQHWDPDKEKLILDAKIYDSNNRKWLIPEGYEPRIIKAYKTLKNNLKINKEYLNGVFKISIQNISPDNSYLWTSWIIEDINNYYRESEKESSIKAIEFLREKINETNIQDLKNRYYSAIQEQTSIFMVADIEREFYIKTIESPMKPYQKAGPNRPFIIFAWLAASFLAIIFIVTTLSLFKREILFNLYPFVLKIKKLD